MRKGIVLQKEMEWKLTVKSTINIKCNTCTTLTSQEGAQMVNLVGFIHFPWTS